ncbi:MAG: threonylcarbamoyl-AMP synthase [Bacteroidales bacterium]|nr:threonylcarbamoyl-AMP synthase [Bacteroidales bacterium]
MPQVSRLRNLEIRNCVKALQKGETLLYPTDTIWGLGCDATCKDAVSRIYRLKNREEDKSFIILADSVEMMKAYVEEVPPVAYDLLEAMSDTPLTIIYPQGRGLADNVPGADGSVAIRIVQGKFCSEVIAKFGKPIVSTSANISGFPAPLKLADIAEPILAGVDHIAIVNEQSFGDVRPSRIIKLEENGMFRVIRE